MTEAALDERFGRLMRRLGARGEVQQIYHALLQAYQEPHRRYHGVSHLRDCLEQFDAASSAGPDGDVAEAALWFHDAVYDPRADDNEARSAELASAALRDAGLPAERVQEIARLVRLTDHTRAAEDGVGALVCDVDLSILGRQPADFAEYERGIRAEYHWVAEPIYRAGRTAVLGRLLRRAPLYLTEHFRVRYEEPARRNLEAALARLAGGDQGR